MHRVIMAQKRQRKAMQPEELAQVMEEEESTDESSLDDDFDQSSDEEVNFSLTEDSEQSEESDHEPDAQPEGDWRRASVGQVEEEEGIGVREEEAVWSSR
ncbi:UNVERIFIED_CONTAM: hypothetical protein FKN15_074290 [Acipenser sinensis]